MSKNIFIALLMSFILGCAAQNQVASLHDREWIAARDSTKYRAQQATSTEEIKARGDSAIPIATLPIPYPSQAYSNGVAGYVKFSFTISVQGVPESLRIIDEDPKVVFSESAKQSILRWRFKPKFEAGKPIPFEGAIYTVQFSPKQIEQI